MERENGNKIIKVSFKQISINLFAFSKFLVLKKFDKCGKITPDKTNGKNKIIWPNTKATEKSPAVSRLKMPSSKTPV